MYFTLVRLLATCTALVALSGAAKGDVFEDVVQILSGPNDTVRKWRHEPTYVFVGDPAGVEAFLNVADHVNGSILGEDTSIGKIFAVDAGRDNASKILQSGKLDFAIRKIDGVDHVSLLTDHGELTTSAIVFYSDGPSLRRLIDRLTPGSPEAKRYSLTSGYCHFEIYSRPTGISASLIFVNSSFGPELTAACMYEEILQSMGLVDDADGTPHFTFDDAVEPERRANDAVLLKALYSKDVRSGDPSRKVAQMVLRNLGQ